MKKNVLVVLEMAEIVSGLGALVLGIPVLVIGAFGIMETLFLLVQMIRAS